MVEKENAHITGFDVELTARNFLLMENRSDRIGKLVSIFQINGENDRYFVVVIK